MKEIFFPKFTTNVRTLGIYMMLSIMSYMFYILYSTLCACFMSHIIHYTSYVCAVG